MTGGGKGAGGSLRIALGRSLGLSVTLVGLHLAAIVSLTVLAIAPAYTVTGVIGLLAAMLWQLAVHGLRSHPHSVTGLEMNGEEWFLQLHSGRRIGPLVLIRERCDSVMIELELRADRRRWHLLLPCDAMCASEFAALRAALSAGWAGDE